VRRLGSLALLALVLATGLTVRVGIGASPGAAGAGAVLKSCGRGVPLEKCNESLNSKPGYDNPAPPPEVQEAAAEVQQCGPSFFDAGTAEALTKHFGLIWCIRLDSAGPWITVGSGMSLTSAEFEAAPGGAFVGILRCEPSDTSCVDADAQHDFGTFEVSYPPLPMSGRTNLQSVDSNRFLMIANGFCGLFTFDVVTGRWYGGAQEARDAILSGRSPEEVATPAEVNGKEAMLATGPSGTGDCPAMAEDPQ
jgi:hypothetical protein